MEYFTESIIILYCLHSWAAYLLCRSRFEKMTTVFLCAGTAVVESAVFLIFADLLEPYGAQVVYGMFALTLAISAILYLILSEESFPRTMFILLSYVQLFLIIIFVSAAVSEIFFGGDVRVKAWIRTPLHAGVLCLYAICFKKKVDAFRQGIRGGWWAMCLLALLYTVYMTYVSMTAQSVSFNRSYVVLFVLLLAVMAAGYGVIANTIRYMKEAALNEQVERQQMIMSQKLEIMQKAAADARRIRHDFRHHMLNLAEYAKNGDNEAILYYLGEYEKEVGSTEVYRLCTDPVIDGILQAYDRKARECGIIPEYEIAVRPGISVKEVDLVAILGNLLENAIHGCVCSGSRKKKIMVRILTKAERLVIVIQNTCSEELKFDLQDGADKKGIGLASIIRSAEKYGGAADFKSNNGIFTSRIVL